MNIVSVGFSLITALVFIFFPVSKPLADSSMSGSVSTHKDVIAGEGLGGGTEKTGVFLKKEMFEIFNGAQSESYMEYKGRVFRHISFKEDYMYWTDENNATVKVARTSMTTPFTVKIWLENKYVPGVGWKSIEYKIDLTRLGVRAQLTGQLPVIFPWVK